jgi:16S rRNA (guanine1207-N2)-methyltransferase
MDNVTATLFYPFAKGRIAYPGAGKTVAILGASPHQGLEGFRVSELYLQQYFKPAALRLQEGGFFVHSLFDAAEESFDYVLAALPKNDTEARYTAAQGLTALKEGGIFLCAADNKAGGGRLLKILESFGGKDVQQISKHKARAAWMIKRDINKKAVHDALTAGRLQKISGGDFVSVPGIFSWNRVDCGSEMLCAHLPETLKGRGADFGCGYGVLSHHVLRGCAGIEAFNCIDADYRALRACQENLKEFSQKIPLRFFWEDLTAPLSVLSDLDFVVMNPPFHEGKTTDPGIGSAFIKTAADSLRSGGMLWMVANAQLPYEPALEGAFSSYRKIFEGDGFKIFCAEK